MLKNVGTKKNEDLASMVTEKREGTKKHSRSTQQTEDTSQCWTGF